MRGRASGAGSCKGIGMIQGPGIDVWGSPAELVHVEAGLGAAVRGHCCAQAFGLHTACAPNLGRLPEGLITPFDRRGSALPDRNAIRAR